eukprot:s1070_g3.t1
MIVVVKVVFVAVLLLVVDPSSFECSCLEESPNVLFSFEEELVAFSVELPVCGDLGFQIFQPLLPDPVGRVIEHLRMAMLSVAVQPARSLPPFLRPRFPLLRRLSASIEVVVVLFGLGVGFRMFQFEL